MSEHRLVLDANIIIRAVLGKKVRSLIDAHLTKVDFFIPDICMEEAAHYLPAIFKKRLLLPADAIHALNYFKESLHIVRESIYQSSRQEAEKRLQGRDIKDWPIAATALMLNAPIWTEDRDFFGLGIPTWTSDRVHLFFQRIQPSLHAREH